MTRADRGGHDAIEERALRRLLQAAGAGEGEGLRHPELLASRVAARLAAAGATAPGVTLGATAWRLLPAFGALVLAVAAWSGYETARLQRAQEATLAAAMSGEGAGADALLIVVMLGGDTAAAEGH